MFALYFFIALFFLIIILGTGLVVKNQIQKSQKEDEAKSVAEQLITLDEAKSIVNEHVLRLVEHQGIEYDAAVLAVMSAEYMPEPENQDELPETEQPIHHRNRSTVR